MNVRFTLLASLLAALAVLHVPARAQTAQITGLITDSTKATVPNAAISVTHVSTGTRRTAETNEQGVYTLPLLQPGEYAIQVRKDGFRSVSRSGIRLEIGQIAQLDFSLEVGDVSESVNVTDAAPLLQTMDASQGQVIANKQVVELPLNGRNYTQLILLGNGATLPEPGTRGTQSGFSSNGQRSYQNNFILDGLDNNSNLLAIQSDSFQVIQPNIDAIQEFKVQTNSYSAEYGRAAGAVVNVAIKSGTNQFHGSAFGFLRNDNIEANNFFNNRSGVRRQEFKQNQFGGTLGGPVVKDRAFFFGDYQGTRIRRASTQFSLVPTALERQGDFSQTLIGGRVPQIFDPATYQASTNTRLAFPGNRIPAERIDPISKRLVELYPAPNLPTTATNYLSNFPIQNDVDQGDIRGDYNGSDKDRFFGRYSYQNQPLVNPPPLPAPAVGGAFSQGTRTFTGHSAGFGYTRMFTPALLNDLRLGYSRVVSNWAATNPTPLNDQYGIRGTPGGIPGLARMTVTGWQALGDPGFLPNLTKANTYEISDAAHWLRGNHEITFGGSARHVQSSLFTTPQTRGEFAFSGNFSRQTSPLSQGVGLSDLLLGIPTTSTLSGTSQGFYLRTPFAFFAQDNWRVTQRLTVNLGVRYEYSPWYRDRYGNISNLFPGNPPRLLTGNDSGIPSRALSDAQRLNLAPRVGLAYQVRSRLVARAGYGLFYGGEEQVGGGVMLHNNPPFNASSAFATDNIRPGLLLRDGFPAGASSNAPVRPGLVSISTDWPTPYGQQWNLTLEQQFGASYLISAAYVGSTGVHLFQTFPINAPQPGPGNINDRRPIQQVAIAPYGTVTVSGIGRVEPRGLSNYHSFQLKSEKRYSSGLFWLASWIWSKAVDYGMQPLGEGTGAGLNNPFDLSAERGRAPFDIRHRLVVSYGYELPFGRGKALLSAPPAAVNHIVGGWQLQGINSYRTGTPFSVGATGNVSNTQSGDRPNVIGNPTLTGSGRTIDRWFDTAVFRPQTPFTFGNAGRNIISSPEQLGIDLSLIKNFRIWEGGSLQFRAEVFNMLNRANFGTPGATLGAADFGAIRTTTTPPRQYQFALKLFF